MLIHHAVRYIGNDMGNFGGTVFTEHVHFKHAIGVRAPSLFPPYPRVIHHDIIINGIGVAYPLAFGHFLHEALPRVITMARLYPHAPILIAINDNIREVLSLLPWIDPARIIEWWAGKWITRRCWDRTFVGQFLIRCAGTTAIGRACITRA